MSRLNWLRPSVGLGPSGTMIRYLVYAPKARKRGSEKWTEKRTLKKSTFGGFWIGPGQIMGGPGGVCGWHLGLKLTNSNSYLARPAPRRGRRIQSLRALRQAREEGFQKKVKPIEQFPLKLNGNSIQVVSRGACDRKGALQGSILSLRWVVKMSQNGSRTPL